MIAKVTTKAATTETPTATVTAPRILPALASTPVAPVPIAPNAEAVPAIAMLLVVACAAADAAAMMTVVVAGCSTNGDAAPRADATIAVGIVADDNWMVDSWWWWCCCCNECDGDECGTSGCNSESNEGEGDEGGGGGGGGGVGVSVGGGSGRSARGAWSRGVSEIGKNMGGAG